MPDRYISDEQVIINTQGLRTVKREDSLNTPGHKWRLLWSYKGQEGFCMYTDQAARDAMYDALRQALTESKQQKQPGVYSKLNAIRLVRDTGKVCGLDIGWDDSKIIVEALGPVMRPETDK